jgi:hypothetical protein
MRRLFFVLCLLMVASLSWIIGSAAALTTTEQGEALLPKADVAPEGCKYRPQGQPGCGQHFARKTRLGFLKSCCTQRLMQVLIQPLRNSPDQFDEWNWDSSRSRRGRVIENLLQTSDRAYRHRRIYL